MTGVYRIVESKECLACESVDSIDCFSLWDDRYGLPEIFQLRRCRDCGSFYPSNDIAKESLGALYQQYYLNLTLDEVGKLNNALTNGHKADTLN